MSYLVPNMSHFGPSTFNLGPNPIVLKMLSFLDNDFIQKIVSEIIFVVILQRVVEPKLVKSGY